MRHSSRKIDPKLKAEVAIEALTPTARASLVAARFGVHPNLVYAWKSHLVKNSRKLMMGNLQKKGAAPVLAERESDLRLWHQFLVQALRSIDDARLKTGMIDPDSDVPISRQATLLGVSRSTVYYALRSRNVKAMRSVGRHPDSPQEGA